jgi:hypothetical protein
VGPCALEARCLRHVALLGQFRHIIEISPECLGSPIDWQDQAA